MNEQTPTVGRIVHYVSYGTPNGEYLPECRAAIVTAVEDEDTAHRLGRKPGGVGLAVLNPGGLFFPQYCQHHEAPRDDKEEPGGGALNHPGGTWHWPERS